MTDFARINQPRVEAINNILAMIHKSARSNKISDDDLRALLAPVAVPRPAPVTVSDANLQEIINAGPGPVKLIPALPMAETPHYHRIGVFVDNLPADQLRSYITYIVNRLCESAAKAA